MGVPGVRRASLFEAAWPRTPRTPAHRSIATLTPLCRVAVGAVQFSHFQYEIGPYEPSSASLWPSFARSSNFGPTTSISRPPGRGMRERAAVS